MNENPIINIRDFALEHEKEITALWMKLAKLLGSYNFATQLAAVAMMVAKLEYSEKGYSIIFDSFLAFSRHVCGQMEEEDRAKN